MANDVGNDDANEMSMQLSKITVRRQNCPEKSEDCILDCRQPFSVFLLDNQ